MKYAFILKKYIIQQKREHFYLFLYKKLKKNTLKKARMEMIVPPKRHTWRTLPLFLGFNEEKKDRASSKMDSPSRKYA